MPKKHKRRGKLVTTYIDNRHHLRAIYGSTAKSIQRQTFEAIQMILLTYTQVHLGFTYITLQFSF